MQAVQGAGCALPCVAPSPEIDSFLCCHPLYGAPPSDTALCGTSLKTLLPFPK